jgi:hypothetical protein
MADLLIDDIILEIISWSPEDWLYVSKKWHGVAEDSIFNVLERNVGGNYSGLDILTAAKVNITRFIKFINSHSRITIHKLVRCLVHLCEDDLNFAVYSRWREFDTNIADILLTEGAEYLLDVYMECRLVDEYGVNHPAVIDNIESGIWNALFEHDGFIYHNEEWLTHEGNIVLKHAIVHYPEYISEYIKRSKIFPINWDPDCMEKVLSYPEIINMVSDEEILLARESLVRERAIRNRET